MKIDSDSNSPLIREAGKLPEGIPLPFETVPYIACGPETGNTFTISAEGKAYVSPDIGDLRDPAVYDLYQSSIETMKGMLDVEPLTAVHDLHPDYVSTRYAQSSAFERTIALQHHHAHAAACMHENGLDRKVLAVVYDGMGLGDDGTVWGGEFLVCDLADYQRKAHLKQYCLPGGDQATRYPERMAYSCLSSEFGCDCPEIECLLPQLTSDEKTMISRIMDRGVNSPLTSSAGRLFDAVAAMLGFSGQISFPAEAAIGLQGSAADGVEGIYSYDTQNWTLNFAGMFGEICRDRRDGIDKGEIAAKFHNTLAAGTVDMCCMIRDDEGLDEVVVSGGVFYNSLLSGMIIKELRDVGFSVYSHRLLPPGDVCVSLGQAVIASVKER